MKRAQNVSNVPYEAAAKELGVSIASIRNWIKTGYIEKAGSKTISRSSWEAFVRDVAGSDKLTKRANKIHRDRHDHESLRQLITARLKSGDADSCSSFYEGKLSNAYRNKEGIYYTPIEIAHEFFDTLPQKRDELHFCDPCCGTGNFLLAAFDAGFSPDCIHGFDVDPIALEIARHRFVKRAGTPAEQLDLRNEDFLVEVEPEKYDVVFTNPPWGKKLPKEIKNRLAQRFGTGKSNDTCSLFVSAALHSLRSHGFLGMLLPDSFFNVAAFEDVRALVSTQRLTRFFDHGKPFEGLVTKAKSFVVKKAPPNFDELVACGGVKKSTHFRRADSFASTPKSRFNFTTTQDEAELIATVFDKPHITLERRAQWGMGIVTGNNKKHVQSSCSTGMAPIWKGADINKGSLRAATNFINGDFSKFQQVANPDLYYAPAKLIYKFISSELVFFLDDEQRLILNSANLVIPEKNFPVPLKLLTRFLNCEFMSWVFKSLFETHKVLRADLESLPIFHEFLEPNCVFEESKLLAYLGIERKDGSYKLKN